MSNSTENMKYVRCDVCHRLLGYVGGDALIKCERCKSDNYIFDSRVSHTMMHLSVEEIRRRFPKRMKDMPIKGENINHSTTVVETMVIASV